MAQGTAHDGERHPGFHINVSVSLMMSYEAIARDLIKSRKGDETAAKDFRRTLNSGDLPCRFRGSAPDHQRLLERREEGLKRGYIPPAGVLLIGAADVQKQGLYVEVVAFAPDRQSYVVEATYIPGEHERRRTARPLQRSGNSLTATGPTPGDARASWTRSRLIAGTTRTQSMPSSGPRKASIRSRRNTLCMRSRGRDGWGHPKLSAASPVDIDLAGRKVRKGGAVYLVGTWPIKASFYADLEKQGDPLRPAGRPSRLLPFPGLA